jgi:hypothetical protein
MEAFGHAQAAGTDLPAAVAASALNTAAQTLGHGTQLDVAIFDRSGALLARTAHESPRSGRNRRW